VSAVRQLEPRSGTRKVLKNIKPKLKEQDIKIGRDRFFELLRDKDLLIKRRKKTKRTTYSNHEYAIAPNRVKDLEIVSSNQVLVADITYIPVRNSFAYLFLLSDLYSRKILGSVLRNDLKHEGAKKALQSALVLMEDSSGAIHHSDRGTQYCCHEFIAELKKNNMLSSMTDDNHCYQNAVAERINGILKQEFFLDIPFPDFSTARKAVEQAVNIYNGTRLHYSLDLNTPDFVYSRAA